MSTVVYLQNALCPQRRRIEQFSGRSIRDLAPAWQTPLSVQPTASKGAALSAQFTKTPLLQ